MPATARLLELAVDDGIDVLGAHALGHFVEQPVVSDLLGRSRNRGGRRSTRTAPLRDAVAGGQAGDQRARDMEGLGQTGTLGGLAEY
jgi:hypothetical protein